MSLAFSFYIDDIAFYFVLHPQHLLLYDHTFLALADSLSFFTILCRGDAVQHTVVL